MKIFTTKTNYIKTAVACLAMLFCLMMKSEVGWGQTYNNSGTYNVPAGVTCIKVEVWGAGGGGSNGGGGGGGGYASSFISVASGNSFTVTVGTGGSAGNDGNYSSFSAGATVYVKAGGGGGAPGDGSGGAGGIGLIGTTLFSGGDGGNYFLNNGNYSGGGGGGSAFSNSNGNNGSDALSAKLGGSGGSGTGNGGDGADRSPLSAATSGIAPGGGGGGKSSNSSDPGSGKGANGRVVVTVSSPLNISNFTTSASSPICAGSTSTITIGSTTLTAGTYNITYDLSAPNASTNNATSVTIASNNGTFNTIALNNSSATTITIKTIALSGGGCTSTLSSGNTATITVQAKPTTATITTTPLNYCGTLVSGSLGGNTPAIGTGAWSQISGPGTVTFSAPTSGTSTATVSVVGTYVFRWTISNGTCTSTADVTVNYYATPTTSSITTTPLNYCGALVSGSLGGNTPSIGTGAWSKVSGPGTVTFSAPTSGSSTATVSLVGSYVFRWTVSNGSCTPSTADVTVNYYATPVATVTTTPLNYCGTLVSGSLGGNTPTAPATGAWSQVSGPGTVTFSAPTSGSSTATVSVVGSYVFRWTVSNGTCTPATADVTVNYYANPTTATIATTPLNYCGTLVSGSLGGNTPSVGTGAWSKVSGPGTVTFSNASSEASTATVSLVGTYVFRWSITNGTCTSTADVTVNYYATPIATIATTPLNYCGTLTSTSLGGNTPTAPATGAWSKVSGPGTVTFSASTSGSSTATVSLVGSYVFRWTVSNGTCTPATADVTVNYYATPVATVTTTPLNYCGTLVSGSLGGNTPTAPATGSWSQVSGPGTVTFSDATSGSSTATVSIVGSYVFKWTVSNGTCTPATANVTVNYYATPTATIATTPLNYCGTLVSTSLGGNTPTAPATGAWSKVSGPGTVTFSAPTSGSSTATVSIVGSYVFRWTVSNGTCTPATADVTVNYYATPVATVTTTPLNYCGTLVSGSLGGNTPTAPATGAWSQVSGPGTVTFSAPTSGSSTATVSVVGSYVFRWTVSNGTCTPATADVTVNYYATPVATIATTPLNYCGTLVSTPLGGNTPTAPATGAWTKVSGPGTVTFSAPTSENSTATVSLVGSYVFKWTVSNGTCTPATANVTVNYYATPIATIATTPLNYCGTLTSTSLGGNTPTAPATGAWSKVSGPGTVTFSASTSGSSTATVSLVGSYVFRWTVSNGTCTPATADVTVNYYATPVATVTTTPLNYCGTLVSGSLGGNTPTAPATGSWSQVSGPGTVTFSDATSGSSTATVSIVGSYVFKWTVSNGTCTPATANVTVNYYATPTATIATTPLNYCGTLVSTSLGGNTPTAPATGAWSKVSGPGTVTFSAPTSGSSTATVSIVGSYVFRWTVSNGTCTPATADVTVNYYATPQGSLTANGPFCTSGTGQLTWTATSGTGPFTIVYNDGTADQTANNVISGTPFNVAANPVTATTTYTLVSIIDNNNCSRSSGFTGNSAIITVYQPPVITTDPVSQTTCATFPVSFTVTATGTGLTYQWYKRGTPDLALTDNSNISGSQTAELDIDQADITDAGTYYVIVSGLSPCAAAQSADAILTVNQEIVINLQPVSDTICAGSTATFTIAATGTGITYKWRKGNVPLNDGTLGDGAVITGSNSTTLTIANVTAAEASDATHKYNVVLTSPGGLCPGANSAKVNLVVNPIPDVNAVSNKDLCNGLPSGAINFSGSVAGTVYQWTNNNTSIGLAASGTGNIASFTATNPGTSPVIATITVTPTYTNGSVTCTGAPITFTISVSPTATVNAVSNQVVCNGASTTAVNFSTTATGGTIVYNWTNSDPTIGLAASGTGDVASFIATNTGNASVTATITVTPSYTDVSTPCAGTSRTFTITVNPTATVNSVSNQVICNSGITTAVNFSSTATGGTIVYNWTNDQPSIGLAASGTGNIASFTATNAGTAPVTATIIVTPSYTNGSTTCIGAPTSFTITVNPTTTVNSISDQTICSGSLTAAVNFSSPTTGGSIVYNWSNNNASIGLAASGSGNIPSFTATNAGTARVTATITVTLSYTNAGTTCTGTPITFKINVDPLVSISPLSQSVCSGNLITTIAPTALPVGTITSWTRTTPAGITSPTIGANGSGPISGTFTSTNATSTVVTFTINTQAANGCTSTVTATVTVYPALTAVTIDASQILCGNSNPVPLTSTGPTGGSGIYTYQWQQSTVSSSGPWINAVGGTGANTSTYTPPRPAATTYYQLIVTNNCGTVTSNAVQISTANDYGLSFSGSNIDATYCAGSGFEDDEVSGSILGSLFGNKYIQYTWQSVNPGDFTANVSNPYGYSFTIIFGLFTLYEGDAFFTVHNGTNAPINGNLQIIPKVYNNNGTVYCSLTPDVVTVTINPVASVNAVSNQVVCKGATTGPITFSSPTTGGAITYSWSNNNTLIGLGASGTGNIPSFTAANSGSSPITGLITVTPSYSNGGKTCSGTSTSFTITVNPSSTVNSVSNQTVCNGLSTAAVNFSGTGTSYSWTNNTPSIGLAASGTGNIPSFTATNPGNNPVTATITVTPLYTNGGTTCPGAAKTFTITVNPTLTAGVVSGTSPLCIGQTATYTTTGSTGGLWSSDNTAVATVNSASGLVTAVGAGTAHITYSFAAGCGAPVSASATLIINPNVTAGIVSGTTPLCIGQTATYASNGTAGGTWSSTVPAVATVNSSTGLVTAVTAGSTNITYTVNSGCGSPVSSFQTLIVSANATAGAISGTSPVCRGTITPYAIAGNSAAGIWSSSNTSVATVDASGNVTAVAAGTSDIIYTVITGCNGPVSAIKKITVSPDADAGIITGGNNPICVGSTVALSSTGDAGGVWTTSDASIATVTSAGVVKGISPGTATIKYTVNSGCNPPKYSTKDITVVSQGALLDPGPITGTTANLCAGSNFTYSIDPVTNATSYVWTVPSGWTIITDPTLNTITVTAGATGGIITVTAANACGFSPTPSNISVSTTPTGQWIGITSNWNDVQNWGCGIIPTLAIDVAIPSGTPNDPVISAGTNAQAKSILINSGASLTMTGSGNLVINNSGNFTNKGVFTTSSSTGTVTFNGTGTITGSSTSSFNNLTMNGALTLTTAPTINGNFTINSGAVLTNSPTYVNSSTLIYNTSSAYTTGLEWNAGAAGTIAAGSGIPQNVTLQSGIVTLSTGGVANRALAGNLTIAAGTTFQLAAGANPSLYILGDWINNGGTFNANSKTVTFNAKSVSSFTQSILGTTTFYNLTFGNSNITTDFGSSNVTVANQFNNNAGTMAGGTSTVILTGGSGTIIGGAAKNFYNLQINSGAVISHITAGGNIHIANSFVNNGSLTENTGYTFYFDKSGATNESFTGTGTTTFGNLTIGDGSGLSTATTLNASADFTVTGGSMSFFHSSIYNGNNNTATFSIANPTTISGSGAANFYKAFTNVPLNPGSGISTFNNSLQINSGGSIITNAPVYGSSASLIYNTTTASLNTSIEWTNNTNFTGAGAPYNVTIQNTNSIVLLSASGSRTVPGLLTIGSANNLDINGQTLTVNGGFSGTGNLKGSASSNLIGGGTGTINFDPAANYLKNFTINSAANLDLGKALNITAGTAPNTFGTVTATGILNANDNLTIKSNANGDAVVGPSSGTISGNVLVERYFPPRRAWRFVTAPVNSSQTINEAWQEGQVNTGFGPPPNTQNFYPGYGTEITYDNNALNGYDFNTQVNPSIRYWNPAINNYDPLPSGTLTTNINAFPGYYLFVRGSRAIDLSQAIYAPPDPTVLRAKGTLNQISGNPVTKSSGALGTGKYFMVGNPYASPINLTNMINGRTGGYKINEFWVWDPKLVGSFGVGAYVAYSNNVWAPAGGSYAESDPPVIQSGQAFLMKLDDVSSSASVEFREADKSISETNVFGLQQPRQQAVFYTNLMAYSGNSLAIMDGVAAAFGEGNSTGIDEKDASKKWNQSESIGLFRNNTWQAIEFRPIPLLTDTLFYSMYYLKQQNYTLQITARDVPAGFPQAWLVDKYLNTKTAVVPGTPLLYNFTATGDINTFRSRFILVFKRAFIATPVPVTKVANQANPGTTGSANSIAQQGSSVSVHPNPIVTGEKILLQFSNMNKGRYQVTVTNTPGKALAERTIDHDGGSNNYSLQTDARWAAGSYFIKITGENGYSLVTKLVISK